MKNYNVTLKNKKGTVTVVTILAWSVWDAEHEAVSTHGGVIVIAPWSR